MPQKKGGGGLEEYSYPQDKKRDKGEKEENHFLNITDVERKKAKCFRDPENPKKKKKKKKERFFSHARKKKFGSASAKKKKKKKNLLGEKRSVDSGKKR